MQAMILAAGFGTRLLPYTRRCPKPLFPLLNDPLLLLTVRRLQAAGFDHILVNCHHLRGAIVSALAGINGVTVQEEESVLGTGGGLRMALSQMRDEPLLVTNGDIYHMVEYRELYHAHNPALAPVTMAMHDYSRFNTVSVQGERVVGFDNQGRNDLLAFTGLHVLQPDILEAIPEGQEYSIIDRYRGILRDGLNIKALRVDGCFWTDMGTVPDYLELHRKLLHREIPLWSEFSHSSDTAFLVDDRATIDGEIDLQDWACVGQAHLEKNTSLCRCVVWDGARVRAGEAHADALLAPSGM